jgi:cyclopropane fatty-acyl-phospholipid synthase-like methyltransferase
VNLSFRDPIDEIANAYQASQILLTANRIGLFAAIGDEVKSADTVAADLDANPRGVRILCDALVDIGLLERSNGGYRNGEDAKRHLLAASPEPRSDLLRHGARRYERWGRLFDSVKTGEPVADELLDPRLLGDEREFARAMADVGRRSARVTCDALNLEGTKSLLDIGGGPGIYAIEFVRRWPELEVTIMDSSEALEVAQENIEVAKVADRVHLVPGDALTDDLGGPYDVVFISNVIHIYSATDNRQLIHRCAVALAEDGRLILKDFFLDEDRKRPPGAVVFAVNMLVSTEGGACYTVEEAESWLESTGLQLQKISDVAAKSRLLVAKKH